MMYNNILSTNIIISIANHQLIIEIYIYFCLIVFVKW